MQIIWHGYSCFTIKGKKAIIVTDPFNPEVVGLPKPKLTADIVTISHDHDGHNNHAIVAGDPKIFDFPGEYESKEVVIEGISTFHNPRDAENLGDNTVFTIIVDDLRICHLGDLGHKLTSEHADEISGVDVLLIPVGGHVTIDAKKAREVVEQIGPRIVVPMHYKQKGMKADLDELDLFLKEMGMDVPESSDMLKINSKRDLGETDAKIVLLHPKS